MKNSERSSQFWSKTVGHWEDVLAMAALLAMAFLPSIEAVTRLFRIQGVPGSAVIVQHMTLWIGFLGAILAARRGKLLSLTKPVEVPEEAPGGPKYWFAKTVTITVTVLLAWASFQMVRVEASYPRDVLPGVPIWVIQSIMPLGFFLIGLEIFKASRKDMMWRALMIFVVIVIGAIGLGESLRISFVVWGGVIALLTAIVFGAPLFIGLGGLAVLFFWNDAVPIAAIPVEMYRIVVSPTLPTIPLFTLAGYILAESGASKRMIEVFRHWFGWMPGGTPVMVTVLCGFFTTLTGGSGVTILALGGLLLPMLRAENYSMRFSIGLITVSGSLGLLFPPSLPAIIYGVTAGVAINKIFLAGILPGTLLVAVVAAWGVRQGFKSGVKRKPFEARKAFVALWRAKWEVAIPFMILVGIFGGFTTLVEVAAFTVVYVLFVETIIYKDVKLNDIPGVIVDCATLVGGVLIILGVAMGLTNYLVDAQVPLIALDWVKENIQSKYVFLLTLNILLLIVGCLMDIFSAIIVVVPLIEPMGVHFGIDPVHMAVIFLANLELGYLTPPVGMNLFLSAYRFDKSMPEVYTATLPFFIILLIAVLAITYIPAISLSLVGGM
ncbi:MAG: TRAP transporter large permease subunit [Candidatus Marinimicrobia bacterium]|nr:TRAP transporter large permease subunit [Candidatus Neomarinimicrobiota bacterium]MDP6835647.1 TRAP transporter large permease subunit [Candidatus Neomarinimicrobiota bacterium]|tara:strand:- start:13 stop:1833 length:1821 start_codon:yes stop_codon:yes gene_type:complete